MKRKRLRTVKGVIAHLGGVEAVALLTKRSKQNVNNWIALRRFSAPTFLIMTTRLRQRRATASPKLWGIEDQNDLAA